MAFTPFKKTPAPKGKMPAKKPMPGKKKDKC
jgi:hypothetical protein